MTGGVTQRQEEEAGWCDVKKYGFRNQTPLGSVPNAAASWLCDLWGGEWGYCTSLGLGLPSCLVREQLYNTGCWEDEAKQQKHSHADSDRDCRGGTRARKRSGAGPSRVPRDCVIHCHPEASSPRRDGTRALNLGPLPEAPAGLKFSAQIQ